MGISFFDKCVKTGGMRFCFFILLGFMALVVVQVPVTQAAITRIQTIGFGSFALRDNDAQHSIVMNSSGAAGYDPEIIPLGIAPQEGRYRIDGLPISTAISVVITPTTFTLNGSGSGNSFSLTSFQVNAPDSDGAGVSIFSFGATLLTSGNGSMYTDGTYSGTLDITVNY